MPRKRKSPHRAAPASRDAYTRREAAERLSVSTAIIDRLIADGRLASIKVTPGARGTRLIPAFAIDEYLREAVGGAAS